MPNTSWSGADALNVNLTNFNLTATATSTGNGGVRSVDRLTSGKYYWEVTPTVFVGGSTIIGVANSSANLASVGNAPANAAGVYRSGGIWVNNASTGTVLGTIGAVAVGFALDIGGALIWIRNGPAGNWNNSGTANPATGAGGINISAIISTGLNALFGFLSANESCTANFGDSAFAGTVPSGFTAGIPGTPYVSTVREAGLVRETLFVTNPAAQSSGFVREVLISQTAAVTAAGITREVLLADSVVVARQYAVTVVS